MLIGNLIAIEEHWITPALTAAVQGSDDSLAFNERGAHGQRLADLGEGWIAAMDEQDIAVSVLALTPPALSRCRPTTRCGSAASRTRRPPRP
ncbi:hypothetical protein ABZS52_24685 [Micromonospora profundi]|uniref:hypothetical protein n=1 Tax=Micromonospora profundi TaxID=1420889 RepID=UPI0033ABD462